jgi:hypothetical protein
MQVLQRKRQHTHHTDSVKACSSHKHHTPLLRKNMWRVTAAAARLQRVHLAGICCKPAAAATPHGPLTAHIYKAATPVTHIQLPPVASRCAAYLRVYLSLQHTCAQIRVGWIFQVERQAAHLQSLERQHDQRTLSKQLQAIDKVPVSWLASSSVRGIPKMTYAHSVQLVPASMQHMTSCA